MPDALIHIQYCYDYLVGQISLGLLIYSHIPTAILALLFGGFVYYNTRRLSGSLLFLLCLSFAAWCFVDIGSWFAFLGAGSMMFTWGLTDFLSLVFFAFAYYFLYVFVADRDLPWWQKLVGLAVLAPSAYWTFLGLNLTAYDAINCEAFEASTGADYVTYARLGFILAAIVFTFVARHRSTDKHFRRKTVLAGTGVSLFLFAFFLFSYLTNLDVLLNAWQYAYNIEIYGLFGMPIFLAYLSYLIVRYHAFDLKIFGAQVLVVALTGLLAAEFAFALSPVTRILIGVTLLLTLVIGFVLVKSVRREIEQREHIEKLAHELELTNQRQESLIHFVGHEVKGYLTKDMGAFAALAEGDLGPLPDGMKPFIEGALASSRDGANSVIDILQASNQKKGTVEYKKEPFDLAALVTQWYEKVKPLAEKKGLTMNLSIDEAGKPYTVQGDGPQTGEHVLRNLFENSVNYTQQGHVDISLKKVDMMAVLTIADTGVGISQEDKKKLFTEGGKGKDSLKVNVHSTGYGLFIAKNVVEAEGGTIRAESEGAGKGSRFIAEFPV
ncbi:MAG TPA: HAMP domain-containing sensor histidine kinase [Candidatus Paceibacterota bacterium]|nr:HAMP domain-containing sensor histidine kinase [Candidatus Paceibacterota bacterium]